MKINLLRAAALILVLGLLMRVDAQLNCSGGYCAPFSWNGTLMTLTGNLTIATSNFYSGILKFGGTTNSFPALKNAGSELDVRAADDSQFANFSALNLGLIQVLARYNNILTAGWGVPAIYGQGRATAQTAAAASVVTYTVGAADGSFLISSNVLVTASTTHTFTVTCTYTDEGNTSRTLTLNFSQITGTFITAITNVTGVGAYEGVPVHIRAKSGTAITIQSAAGGTYTSVTYNIEGYITQIG